MSSEDNIRTPQDSPTGSSPPESAGSTPNSSPPPEMPPADSQDLGTESGAPDSAGMAAGATAPAEVAAQAIVEAELAARAAGSDVTNGGGGAVHQARFAPLREGAASGQGTNLDLLLDVSVTVTAEMGSRSLPLEQVLELKPGSVVELDRSADEPIDLLVNGKPIARGEVVVIEDQFGVRITEILDAKADQPKKEAAKS